jgi:hypothetical protein
MDWGALLTYLGGMASTAVILMLRAYLEGRRDERRMKRATRLDEAQRRIETDRATYRRRLTTLVQASLATYIRSGRWRTDDDDLDRLLMSLEQGAYEDFVDPEVNAAWTRLIAKTLLLVRRRRARTITPEDVAEYNELHRTWEDAAKRSFGPLPEPVELPTRRPRVDGRRNAA